MDGADSRDLPHWRPRWRQALPGQRYRGGYRFTVGNAVRLFHSGEPFFTALLARIDAATTDVMLETYIFADDGVGRAVSDALLRAAARGVRVRVITDGLGTGRLRLLNEWPAGGIEHCIYNPHLFGRFGFSRTHRKLAVIDQRFAYCGGINIISDVEQNGVLLPFPRWDFAVELSGPSVADVRAAFELQWCRIQPGRSPSSVAAAAVATAMAASVSANPNANPSPDQTRESTSRRVWRRIRKRSFLAAGEPCVAFVARDNLINRRAIEKAYLVAIGKARAQVLLANPYFMPGRKLRRALKHAAQRGVDVRLVIGKKEFAALDYAVPFLYRSLLRAGVKIAEYERTMLHGKVAVVDSNWCTVGSSNLDALSLVLNNEANVLLVLHPEIDALREALLVAFDEAHQINLATYEARPAGERLLNWAAYTAYRTVMRLLTVGGYD
ncbi:phospholipase D-like domain-containing protein [Paraburkholderia bonniea]|uniref:phospholipase D-like domain-containing protein n=1 Tax=Paraburkholderia bonniea TaxID=2152891 RepID=UPI001292127B|nr:phospholipase D-like domain-containing protein [Paraburkholderia bonniea]WJF90702.1 phospholipase D-like domain-containing protein [Paraburkholderia bonniea]WJF94015.1 phospholipase D-like domain-containing protein [Paraburkholderia bonniea]